LKRKYQKNEGRNKGAKERNLKRNLAMGRRGNTITSEEWQKGGGFQKGRLGGGGISGKESRR